MLAGSYAFQIFFQKQQYIFAYLNFMTSKIDWNDSIQNFIKIKVERPEALADLFRREKQCSQKKNYEKKIGQKRKLYQQYSISFKTEQQKLQLNTSLKRQMQREIARLAIDISKLLKQLVRQENQVQVAKAKSETAASEQVISNKKKKIMQKQQSNQFLIAQYALIKQNLKKQIKDLSGNRADLNEKASKLKSRQQILKIELNKQLQIKITQEQIAKSEQQLLKQRQLKTIFKGRLQGLEANRKKSKRNRNQQQALFQRSLKRMKDFNKEYKKIMGTAQSRSSEKYVQFVKKYRIHTPDQAKLVSNQYQAVRRRNKGNSLLQSIDYQFSKYQEPLENLSKAMNSNFTPKEFQEISQKCQNIYQQIITRQSLEEQLSEQIQNLKEHLERKTKELQMEYQRFSKNR